MTTTTTTRRRNEKPIYIYIWCQTFIMHMISEKWAGVFGANCGTTTTTTACYSCHVCLCGPQISSFSSQQQQHIDENTKSDQFIRSMARSFLRLQTIFVLRATTANGRSARAKKGKSTQITERTHKNTYKQVCNIFRIQFISIQYTFQSVESQWWQRLLSKYKYIIAALWMSECHIAHHMAYRRVMLALDRSGMYCNIVFDTSNSPTHGSLAHLLVHTYTTRTQAHTHTLVSSQQISILALAISSASLFCVLANIIHSGLQCMLYTVLASYDWWLYTYSFYCLFVYFFFRLLLLCFSLVLLKKQLMTYTIYKVYCTWSQATTTTATKNSC